MSLANAAARGTSERAVSDGHYHVHVSALRSGDGGAEGGRDIGEEEVGVAWRKWVWYAGSGCGMEVFGVAWRKWVWHGGSGCGMKEVGVAWRKWVWHGGSGCGMKEVGVAWRWYE